jgi:hypothetical protein
MRASDLLGARVVTGDGGDLGHVVGLRCTLDGPSSGPLAAPRIAALVVSRRRTAASLGYTQDSQRGPWLIGALVHRLHRDRRLVDWTDIADIGDGTIRLRSRG